MKIESGWLVPVRRVESPNSDERPLGTTIDLIVLHNISLPPNEFGGPHIVHLFCNQLDADEHPYFKTIASLRVSSHLLVDRSGAIIQFVPFHQRAWHAGQSCYQGRDACNDFSIGIELEGSDQIPYTEAQYAVLFDILAILMRHYPAVTAERIVGHQHIAPQRKTDPGAAFNWKRLRQQFAHSSQS